MELVLLLVFSVCWILALILLGLGSPLAGLLDLGLYQLYGVAAFAGWLAGNVYVHRSRGLAPPVRRRLIAIYLLGPPGVLYLLRSLAPTVSQATAPLAPVYASAVYAIFFLVPLSLRGAFRGSSRGSR